MSALSRELGSVRIRRRDRIRYPLETLSGWAVKRESGVCYLVLLFNVGVQPKPTACGKAGIDVGVKGFLTLSTGEKVNCPGRLRQLAVQNVTRKAKGEAGRKRQTSAQRSVAQADDEPRYHL